MKAKFFMILALSAASMLSADYYGSYGTSSCPGGNCPYQAQGQRDYNYSQNPQGRSGGYYDQNPSAYGPGQYSQGQYMQDGYYNPSSNRGDAYMQGGGMGMQGGMSYDGYNR